MRIVGAALVAAALLSGCNSGPETYELVMLDSVSENLEAIIRDAADDWHSKVPELNFVIRREHAWSPGGYHTMWFSEVDDVPGNLIGHALYGGAPGETQIDIEYPVGVNGSTVRHEMGHGLGLKHQFMGVMMDRYTPNKTPMTVQDCDVQQYRVVWGP